MDTIESTLSAQDYQILVTDTDTLADGGNCNGSGPSCCDPYCATDPLKLCGDKTCPGIDGCLIELGAGRAEDRMGRDCGLQAGKRYITAGQPDLPGSFACIAEVGIEGSGNELAMASMLAALDTQASAGGCNAGFLREDDERLRPGRSIHLPRGLPGCPFGRVW